MLVHRHRDDLVITVTDSGPGFGARPTPEGIGLSNTRGRILHLYGQEATLSVGNRDEGGGVVRVTIPWHTAREAQAAP